MCAPSGADVDDLDLLMQQYAEQANMDLLAVASAPAPRPQKRARATERLDAGLAAPLAEENKGFQMLARMGYQAGQGIGATGDGRVEPVAVDLKQNRLGLGAVNKSAARREAQRQQEVALATQQHERQQQAVGELEQQRTKYQQRAAGQFAARNVDRHLRAGQAACLTLDTQAGVESNVMWRRDQDDAPPAPGDGEEEEAQGGDHEQQQAWEVLPSEEKLGQLTEYLRTQHCYCIYCAVRYSNAQDLAENCPGLDDADH
jgi:hypothetical protein